MLAGLPVPTIPTIPTITGSAATCIRSVLSPAAPAHLGSICATAGLVPATWRLCRATSGYGKCRFEEYGRNQCHERYSSLGSHGSLELGCITNSSYLDSSTSRVALAKLVCARSLGYALRPHFQMQTIFWAD